MFLHYYNKNEEIPKKQTIDDYENIFLEYKDKIPTLYEALYQMYRSLDIADQKAYLLSLNIIDKSKKVIEFNYDLINEKYGVTKEEAMIIASYSCEAFDSDYSPYKVVNNIMNDENRFKGIRSISKYLYIFLKALRQLSIFYPQQKYMYRCINKQINLKKDIFDERIVPFNKGTIKTFYGFLSVTSEKDMTYDLKGKKENIDKGTIFEIYGNFRGYDISLFNKLIDEHIIIEPEHILKIINAVYPNNNNKEIFNVRCEIQKTSPILINLIKPRRIKIKYTFDNNNTYSIKIFGREFVERNKSKCKIYYNNQIYPLDCYINASKIKNNSLEISLEEIQNITDLSYMFSYCSSILSLSFSYFYYLENITNISYMFYKCTSLLSIDNISELNTSNVTDMSYLFNECNSLLNLPDISNWNTSKVIYMNSLFHGCSSLTSLPDISKWNIYNVKSMNSLFRRCSLINNLPDISKWNTSNVTDISKMFSECKSLIKLPDISKWNTTNIKNMNYLFFKCSSLLSLPNISKWNVSNVTDINNLFMHCSSLSYIPNISKWDIKNVKNINFIFNGCSSLVFLPDFSRWKKYNINIYQYMPFNCVSLSYLPELYNNISFIDNINCCDLK